MPRSFGGRSSGPRSGGARSEGGRSQSSGSRSQNRSPKGQVKNGKSVQYAIKGENNETKYIGTTGNPRHRAAQHMESGKMQLGDRLEVQSRAIPREKAEGLEAGRLQGHRQTHGQNPKHNTTNDGKYHPRRK